MAIEFLALPKEQLEWLRSLLSQRDVWCWIRLFEAGMSRITSDPGDLDALSFDSECLAEIDLGRYEIQQPVFKETGYGVDLDFPRSLAVQFRPSLVLKKRMLTTGQLAISSSSWYEYFGVDAAPVQKWYRTLSIS